MCYDINGENMDKKIILNKLKKLDSKKIIVLNDASLVLQDIIEKTESLEIKLLENCNIDDDFTVLNINCNYEIIDGFKVMKLEDILKYKKEKNDKKEKKTIEKIDLNLCLKDNMRYEKELKEKGYKIIGGVDEVGRGPLIGPVVACCAVLNDDFNLNGLTDSKKLSEKKREEFYDYLIRNTIYGLGVVGPEVIDEINIYEASKLAMKKAISEVSKKVKLDYLLVDAMPLDLDIPTLPIIKGDLKSRSISAASVIAKVTRDRMMIELDKKYPNYGYKLHKGYPTKKHLDAIHKYGLIDGYRKSYGPIKEIIEGDKNGN